MYLLAEGQLPAERTHVLSTSGMLKRARESDKQAFIVATEVGILYQMERQNPGKTFIPANRAAVCPFMKMITLEKVRDALAHLKTVIEARPTWPRGPASRLSGWWPSVDVKPQSGRCRAPRRRILFPASQRGGIRHAI